MNPVSTLDPEFATAVRAELVAAGTRDGGLPQRQRRGRLIAIGIAAFAVAGATTGAAIVVGLPGTTTTTPVSEPVTVTSTGSATVDLGPTVSGANAVILDLTCVSNTGTISVPLTPGVYQDASGEVAGSGSEAVEVNCASLGRTVHIADGLLAPGATSIAITSDPETTWKVVARYATATTTEWSVNANGQTYGAPNKTNGEPDLQPAMATNGSVGYIFTDEILEHDGNSIPVYESDGTTVIGEFVFSDEIGTITN